MGFGRERVVGLNGGGIVYHDITACVSGKVDGEKFIRI